MYRGKGAARIPYRKGRNWETLFSQGLLEKLDAFLRTVSGGGDSIESGVTDAAVVSVDREYERDGIPV
jgi:hypothetical protein